MRPRTIFALFAVTVLFLPGAQDVPITRPPTNALRRYEPKKYEIKFEVALTTVAAVADQRVRGRFNFTEAPIVMPVIFQGAYSKVFVGTPDGGMIIDAKVVPQNVLGMAIDDNKPYNTHLLRMVAPKTINATAIRWKVTYLMQSWSAAVHEERARQATWPRDLEWPDEAKDGLKPQKFIESDHPGFKQIIKENGGDQLRTVSPYIAAKQIVALCLNRFQISGAGVVRGGVGQLRGLRVQGAFATVANPDQSGRWVGSEHDLVCVCVALLRAANIPARPVIGIAEEFNARGRKKKTFVTWAEFYLPGSGWVSFDPAEMKRKGGGQYRDLTRSWPEFGTMDELNERVPLSYFFLPPATGAQSPGGYYVATWGWDPRPNPRQDSYDQSITLQITSRGRGVEDPR